MIFQLLEGGELFDRVLKKKKYDERESAIVMKQLLEALIYLENKGIIHRDLKLENILLVNKEDDCLIKLADFGLSVTLENLDPKVRCGTPGYVAPEILADEKYDEKVDIFSAGVILYILYLFFLVCFNIFLDFLEAHHFMENLIMKFFGRTRIVKLITTLGTMDLEFQRMVFHLLFLYSHFI